MGNNKQTTKLRFFVLQTKMKEFDFFFFLILSMELCTCLTSVLKTPFQSLQQTSTQSSKTDRP